MEEGRGGRLAVDRKEVGRMMAVASSLVFLMSIQTYYSLDTVETEIKSAETSLEDTNEYVTSESFQRSLEGLRDLSGTSGWGRISGAMEGFERLERTLQEVRGASDKIEQEKRLYQWLSLLGFAGIVAGLSILFI